MPTVLETPIGPLQIEASDRGLSNVCFASSASPSSSQPTGAEKIALEQLSEFFTGERTQFDLPLDLETSDFDREVLMALAEIPYGETRTYGQLATAIGKPKAARAVGGALNRNPLAVVLPCHRVVGQNGSLTGFAGGLDVKRKLLELEGHSF